MAEALAGRRAAVIGATGFIGSHLAELLVRQGAEVLAVAHTPQRLGNLAAIEGQCRFELADILRRDAICACLEHFRPEIVFHMAADVDASETFEHIRNSIANNTTGTSHVLEAAALAGARLLVYADSCKVYGNGPVPYRSTQPDAPVCSYAIGKAAGWRLCLLAGAISGLAVASVRSTFVYGPRQNPNLLMHVRDCATQGVPVRLLGGSQTRDLLYVEDAVRAYAAVAVHPATWGRAIPIGGGRELSVAALCREIVAVLGSDTEIVPEARPPRLTEIWRSYCDNAEAGELLGWRPEVSLEEGLARTLLPDAIVAR